MRIRKRYIFTALILISLLVGLFFFLFSGDNRILLRQIFKDDLTKEEFADLIDNVGYKGYITVGILSFLQVLLTVIPAEPIQVMGGVMFGILNGFLICLAGVIVGNTVIYILYKIYGKGLSDYYQKNISIDFDKLAHSNRMALLIFILYFLPAIPYGLICFFTASLNVKYPKYIFLTGVGSIPSILIGVGLGHLAVESSWTITIIVFSILIVLIVLMYIFREKLFSKFNKFAEKKQGKYSSRVIAKKYNPFLYRIIVFFGRIYYAIKIKIRLKNNVKEFDKPSIIICNHGSFIDFVYAGQLAKKSTPHYITARMYFYHKWLAKVLKLVGCFPKSMFTVDIENAKNCMRIINNNGTILLFPEARLSTSGKYEGVQDVTYRFIQKTNCTVYVIKMRGDYLANPKWGDKIRGNSYVEGTLDLLISKEQLGKMSYEELKTTIDNALDYNDFNWLEQHPEVKYKSKTLAEGLENILSICPHCHSHYTLKTKGLDITCTNCGFTRSLDNRYAFTEKVPFNNFQEWYDWQKLELEKEIMNNDDYCLESKVILKHSSNGGKTILRTAGAGICKLNKDGLTFIGEDDGQTIEKHFKLQNIYRILFGAGVDFEIYDNDEIWFFVPEELRSCVTWYIASEILKKKYCN